MAGSAAGSRTVVLLPRLEGNYRDKDRDSEGNTPGFQRSPYQDEGERWHDGCSVFYLCWVHFLSQRQAIPEQKTWLKKKSHADADEGSVIIFFFLGTVPCGATLIKCFSATVFNLGKQQKMELVCRHLETVSLNKKKLVRKHSWMYSHIFKWNIVLSPIQSLQLENRTSPCAPTAVVVPAVISKKRSLSSCPAAKPLIGFKQKYIWTQPVGRWCDWSSSSCLVDNWWTLTEDFGVLDT